MLKIGIVGLPNVGKSTLFKALTHKKVDIANFPFTTIDPNVGAVLVPDERLEQLGWLIKPKRTIPSVIEIVDVAGIIKGAHKGEGLGNQFLSHLQGVDAILVLLRIFKNKEVISMTELEPAEQLQIIREELAKKDEEIELRRDQNKKEDVLWQKLSEKPYLSVCNINSDGENYQTDICDINLDSKFELDLEGLSENEIKELNLKSDLPKLIVSAYNKLNLITFYTIKGGEEVRAWPLLRDLKAPQAGRIVHSDFEEKFIKAEIIGWQKLLACGSWSAARQKGLLRLEGRNYVVQDGDVIEFKI